MQSSEVILICFAVTLLSLAAYNARTLTLPNVITLSGISAGLVLSFSYPSLHGESHPLSGLVASVFGLVVGLLSTHILMVGGKALLGKEHLDFGDRTLVVMDQTSLILPGQTIAYDEIFYRYSDEIRMNAASVALTLSGLAEPQRFENVSIALAPGKMVVGNRSYELTQIERVEAVTDSITLPREALGFGVVKVMGFIGTFVGWQGVLFAMLCGGLALLTAALIRLASRARLDRVVDPVTPTAIAAVIWIIMRPQVVWSAIMAIALGALLSCISERIAARWT